MPVSAEPASCPLCGSGSTSLFLEREQVPVHQNLPLPDAAAARAVARGRLAMRVCGECGFIYNAAFDPGLLSYGGGYDNTQSCSPAFDRYLDDLARGLVDALDRRGCLVVEVGCGKGGFLRKLRAAGGGGLRGVGFDPSYVGPAEEDGGALRFVQRYYDGEAAAVPADAVVCRHVIEHVQHPGLLLQAVRAAVRDRPDARIFFETPCVDWILDNQVTWDFFYEHCSLFTAHSLAGAFSRNSFAVSSVRHVFAGQYLWLEARPVPAPLLPERHPPATAAAAQRFAIAEDRRIATWIQRIEGLARTGRCALWGAGAKGVTFANLVDPEGKRISCLVDVNPNKQGKYVPGTGHPIIPPAALAGHGIAAVVLLNPNYAREVGAELRRLDLDLPIIDLMEPGKNP